MNLTQIVTAINNTGFTNAELDEISAAIKFARAQLGYRVANTLKLGANVSFISNRNGQKYIGTVEKIAIKNVIVRTALGRYRVPANMLEVQ
jgi:hypothetical protein